MNKPVVIYSSWRTSSTWFWTKFRQLPETVAYNEVYHGQLTTITAKEIESVSPEGWESHHPKTESYFLEFLPLLNDNGVGIRGVSPDFEYKNFVPALHDEGLPDEEKAYLDTLVDNARKQNKTAVLTCTRNLARLPATKRSLDGVHIVTTRNLWHQWMSYAGQGLRKNPWFLETIRAVYESSHKQDPVLAALYERHRETLHRPGPTTANAALFHAFVSLHLLLYARAVADADMILDVNRLARDATYRSECQRRITEITGLSPDFSDATESIDFARVEAPEEATLLDEIAFTQRLLSEHGYPVDRGPVQKTLERLIREMIDSLRHHRASHGQILKRFSTLESRIEKLDATLENERREFRLREEEIARLQEETRRLADLLYSTTAGTHLYRAIKTALKDPHYNRRQASPSPERGA